MMRRRTAASDLPAAAVLPQGTHAPKQEVRNGVLYFNPGSAGPQRFKLPVTLGRLIVEDGKVRSELVNLLATDH